MTRCRTLTVSTLLLGPLVLTALDRADARPCRNLCRAEVVACRDGCPSASRVAGRRCRVACTKDALSSCRASSGPGCFGEPTTTTPTVPPDPTTTTTVAPGAVATTTTSAVPPAPTTTTLPDDLAADPQAGATMQVHGRELYDADGEQVVLRGVNKMNVWTVPDGHLSFPEIHRAGANTVRIVWAINPGDFVPTADDLDVVIGNALAQHLIPMIELHDATGDLGLVGQLVDWWVRPEVVAVVRKYERFLLVNIANEAGNDEVESPEFLAVYTDAVARMRAAGIRTPLVIDAPDYGKNIDVLVATAADLVAGDPEQNLLFSVHVYWPMHAGADAAFIWAKLGAAAAAGVPLIVGEFSRWGAYAGAASMCSMAGEVDYQSVLQAAHEYGIGWYAWEWGPGNAGGGDPLCSVMDMTTDDRLESLQAGWATDVVSGPYGIGATAVIPAALARR